MMYNTIILCNIKLWRFTENVLNYTFTEQAREDKFPREKNTNNFLEFHQLRDLGACYSRDCTHFFCCAVRPVVHIPSLIFGFSDADSAKGTTPARFALDRSFATGANATAYIGWRKKWRRNPPGGDGGARVILRLKCGSQSLSSVRAARIGKILVAIAPRLFRFLVASSAAEFPRRAF